MNTDVLSIKRTPAFGEEPVAILQESLDGLLELTGAGGGWISLKDDGQHLQFPVRGGAVSESWLALQQGCPPLWGFEVSEGPTVLNDLPPLPFLGEQVLRNFLSCPLLCQDAVTGHAVLVNKPDGFTSHDATVLQASAHLVGRYLRRWASSLSRKVPSTWLQLCADRAAEAILLFDDAGTLVFANQVWLEWTGYSAEEMCHRPGPYPFWPNQRQLAALTGKTPVLPRTLPAVGGRLGYLPFRHRNQGLFWCQAETFKQQIDSRILTVAFLRRLPGTTAEKDNAHRDAIPLRAEDWHAPWNTESDLPAPERLLHCPQADWQALLFSSDGAIEFWDERWEVLTGWTPQDLAGVAGETVLDWLFPRQRDRELVADLFHRPGRQGRQAILDVAGKHGSQPLCCTFLPVRERDERGWVSKLTKGPHADASAWLLLVCEPQPAERQPGDLPFSDVHEMPAPIVPLKANPS